MPVIHEVADDGTKVAYQSYELECGCYFYQDEDGIAFSQCELHWNQRKWTIIASCEVPQLTLPLA